MSWNNYGSTDNTNIEMKDIHKEIEINLDGIMSKLDKLHSGTQRINETLASQTEQLGRISTEADNLGQDIDRGANKARSILSKLDRSVWPLYICIIVEFIVIIALTVIVFKGMLCLLTY